MKFLFHAYYTLLLILNKSMKAVLASSKVTFATSTFPSLEIPSCLWINIWSMKISWPRTHTWIFPSFVASQVCKKSCNKSSLGIVHCRLNKPSKPIHLAHLSSLESLVENNPFFNQNVFDYTSFATALQLGFFPLKKNIYWWFSFKSTCLHNW
jgi:hypothetical protein